jgi:hypothetical protein
MFENELPALFINKYYVWTYTALEQGPRSQGNLVSNVMGKLGESFRLDGPAFDFIFVPLYATVVLLFKSCTL